MTGTFIAFARALGVIIEHEPPLGQWRRYKTADKPRKRNGAVKFMGEVGFVRNWGTMDDTAVWHSSSVDQVVKTRNEEEARRLRELEQRRRRASIDAMRAYWGGLLYLRGGHPYIEGKGLSMGGCGKVKVDRDLLVIPMYRRPGLTLMSLQTITPTGEKKYRAGCPTRGCSLELAHRTPVVTCLVEGFATGLAVYQSVPTSRVIVCFDAGNMVQVARELRVSGLTVVCADNDHGTEARMGINPGLTKGREAATAIGCGIAAPQGIAGTDWADALAEWGADGPARLRIEVMRGAQHVRPT